MQFQTSPVLAWTCIGMVKLEVTLLNGKKWVANNQQAIEHKWHTYTGFKPGTC